MGKRNFKATINGRAAQAIVTSATTVTISLRFAATAPNASLRTLTYDANGGTGAPAPIHLQTFINAAISTIRPTRINYTFLGWSRDPKATTAQYQPGVRISFTDNTTLFAVWSKTGAIITIDAANGSPAPQLVNWTLYVHYQAPPRPQPPVGKNISDFGGWHSDVDGSITQPGGRIFITQETRLTAIWNPAATIERAQAELWDLIMHGLSIGMSNAPGSDIAIAWPFLNNPDTQAVNNAIETLRAIVAVRTNLLNKLWETSAVIGNWTHEAIRSAQSVFANETATMAQINDAIEPLNRAQARHLLWVKFHVAAPVISGGWNNPILLIAGDVHNNPNASSQVLRSAIAALDAEMR